MAEDRKRRDASGTSGGTDVEPLRGGMRELEEGRAGPGHAPEKDPPAPYHGMTVPEGGLAPRAAPGEGAAPADAGAARADRDARQDPSDDIEATAGERIPLERREFENEASNARRDDPGAPRGAPPGSAPGGDRR